MKKLVYDCTIFVFYFCKEINFENTFQPNAYSEFKF